MSHQAADAVESVSVMPPGGVTREVTLSAHLKLYIGASTRFRNTLEVSLLFTL